MKQFQQRFIVMMLIFMLTSNFSYSQDSLGPDDSFYVVIGAFANPRNAIDHTEKAKQRKYDAQYSLNPKRNLYYVYILNTNERTGAVELAVKLQAGTFYSDTWVYTGLLGDNPQVVKIEESEKKEILAKEQAEDESVLNEVKEEEDKPAIPSDGSKPFMFKILSTSTNEEVIGDVDVFDADLVKGHKVASYRGNDAVNVKPVNKSGNLLVVCDIFGYRKLQIPVNFDSPQVGDGVSLNDGKIVLTFELVRLQKGDKVVMYNVNFYKDAAIMRPESRYELNALLDYLQEVPNAKIMIHGHTNGNGHGKIISMGNSTDFFSINGDVKNGSGSAVKLSEERAKVIQSYLVKQGIDIKRMKIKGWGGKQPIYDEDHTLATANVRVEVEVLED
jgi:outer membrane protein OmpA-like peptidoglycan-associated protein